MAPKWMPEEDAVLKNIYENNSKAIILSTINKPWTTICRRARRLNLHRAKHLIDEDRKIRKGPPKDSCSPEEKALLQEIFEHNSKSFILSKFKPYNRSWQSICRFAKMLGLKRDRELFLQEMAKASQKGADSIKWPQNEIDILKKIYTSNNKNEIMNQLPNRSWLSIRQMAIKLGLKRDDKIIKNERMVNTKKNMLANYGVEYSTQLDSMKEKTQQTNLKKYGVEYPAQSSKIQEKIKKVIQEKYDVDNVFQSEEIKEKIKKILIKKYGITNPLKNKKILEKIYQTNNEKYGAKNLFQRVDLVQNGMLKKYGYKSPQQVPEIKEKTAETNIKEYGFITPAKNEKVKQKTENTNLDKYGFKTPFQNEEVKKRIIETNLKRYGVTNPAKLEEIQKRIKKTNLKKFGIECLLELKEIRDKGIAVIKKNKSFNKSDEELKFWKYLKEFDPKTENHVEHPEIGHIIDFYMPKYDLWIQYDGVYWHGKIHRTNITRQALKIAKTIKRDEFQNKNIPNLIRFWSDHVLDSIENGTVLNLIKTKIQQKNSSQSFQYQRKLEWFEQDKKQLNFDISQLSAKHFTLTNEPLTEEIIKFIKKYEWLGTIGAYPKWCFTARYSNILGGVVLINEPNAYSKILGKNTNKYEALIQRGATASWTPKNLGSRLIMYACNYMINNTNKRAFVGYGDPRANEIGTIYQACNFDYLGKSFGSSYLFKHPKIKDGNVFSSQYLKRTSSFKKWCKKNQIKPLREWFKENKIKDINTIPAEIKNKWYDYNRKILKESIRIKVDKKHKYVLIIGKTKYEKKLLNSLKTYKTYPYPKTN